MRKSRKVRKVEESSGKFRKVKECFGKFRQDKESERRIKLERGAAGVSQALLWAQHEVVTARNVEEG